MAQTHVRPTMSTLNWAELGKLDLSKVNSNSSGLVEFSIVVKEKMILIIISQTVLSPLFE